MAKLLKTLGIVLGALVGLLVVALVLVTLLFDPNDYKPEIAAAVEDATGRTLTLDGDLELQVFPRLRIALGQAELSNAAGFGEAPFARIQSAQLQVGLLPLILSQSLEVDEARLEGLTLNLARDAQGRGNWEDLGGGAAEPAAASPDDQLPGEPGEATEFTFEVQGIAVENAEVNWTDATTGATWRLANFNLELTDFGPDAAFPMRTSFSLTGDELALDLVAEMRATLGLADNNYLLEDLVVDIDGRGEAWPGGEGAVAMRFDALQADLDAETVDLRGLELDYLDVSVSGNLAGRNLFSSLSLSGDVDIQAFDPQPVMEVFGVELETADPDVLQQVAASAQLVYDSDRMMLEQMSLTLDDSALTGSLGMQGDTLTFDLDVDALNADRYLPPAEDEPQAEEEGSLDEVDLPLDFLRSLAADGRLAIGSLQFDGLAFSDVALRIAARDGRVSLMPSAGLYGGTYGGTIGIDVQQDAALLTLQQRLESVDVASFMRDYLDSQMFTGTVGLEMDVSATGANVGELMRELDGDVSFALTDGAWEGVDLWHQMRRARALTEQTDAPPPPQGPPRTPFSRISASGAIENAVLRNDDLLAELEFMSLTGSGTVELLNDTMDFDVMAAIADSELVQNDPLMADLAGDSLPLTVTGSLTAPTVRPDYGAIVRERAQEAVDERVEEEREQIREQLEDRLRGIFDR